LWNFASGLAVARARDKARKRKSAWAESHNGVTIRNMARDSLSEVRNAGEKARRQATAFTTFVPEPMPHAGVGEQTLGRAAAAKTALTGEAA